MSAIDNEWMDARIARTKASIVIYEDAIDALTTTHQTYTIQTAQTQETVTRTSLGQLRATLSSLENRLATLNARRYGSSRTARPGF